MGMTNALPLGLAACAVTLAAASPALCAPPEGYHLVWSDEFNAGKAPDPAKWSYDTEANALKWWHDEAQYYSANRPENARIEDGHLIIEVRREELKQNKDWVGQHYSSARLITRGKGDWAGGFFDIRAKLACNRGGWPAIWLLGPDWPRGGEIDIMEQLSFDPATIYGTFHSPHSVDDKIHQGDTVKVPDACTAFHNYQVEWTHDAVTVQVDGKPYYHLDRPAAATPANWPYDGPEFIVLNMAMGGWGGQKGIDDAALPARMEVDYVRVYQRK